MLVARLPRADAPEQVVLDAVRVHRGARPTRFDASDLLRSHAEEMVGPRPWRDGGWEPPRSVLVTVVCRTGRVVPGPEETFWMLAWHYSNHVRSAFDGDVYVVTEHGWTGCHDKRAGFTPALRTVAQRHLSAL
ncbi:MAG: hypothetical protein ACRCY8_15540 [Dermatophilaceae bacterium]